MNQQAVITAASALGASFASDRWGETRPWWMRTGVVLICQTNETTELAARYGAGFRNAS